MPSRPTADSLADQLLDAQVHFHLDRLSGAELDATLSGLAADLLGAAGSRRVADLVDRETVKAVVVRTLRTVPGSSAARGVVDVVTTVVHDGPADPHPIGELVDRDRVEALLDELLALTPVLERALDRLTASPLVGTTASRFMGRIVGEVLQANKAVAGKVPGLGTLMSFGTSAASKVVGAADKQFEGLIGDTVGKGGTFAVRRLNRIVLETLRDPTTREALLQVWDLVAQEQVTGLGRVASREETARVVDAVEDLVVDATAGEHVARLAEAVVDALLDRFADHTLSELLDELDLGGGDVAADLARLATPVVAELRASGELEQIFRARLEPFYSSDQIRTLLG